MQAVIITLDPDEIVQAEAGAMMYMTDGIQINTGTEGGWLKGVKRVLSGESFFITTFKYEGSGQGDVSFAAPYPGKIIPAVFSGEGLFFALLTGPGKVFLQTLPFSRLADRIASAFRTNVGEVKRGASVWGTLGNIIGGDR